MHCVHKKRLVCFRIIRWLLASLRIVLSRLMYLTVIYITLKCFMYYVDFNLPPEYHNFCCDSNPLPLSLQRENDKSFSLKTLWDKHDFFLNPSPFLITIHCRHGIIYERTFLSCIFYNYLSFTNNFHLGVHGNALKISLVCADFHKRGKKVKNCEKTKT